MLCTFSVTWPRESDTPQCPHFQRSQQVATGEAGAPRASDGGRGGGGGGGRGEGGSGGRQLPSRPGKARSHPTSFVSEGILPVVTMEQLSRVVGIMACCPARQEVDRALSTEQGRMDRQPLVTTLAEVKRALQKYRLRVAKDKDFSPLLLQHIIQYVCNSVTAGEAGLSHDPSFLAQLKSWIKQRLIPFLNETSLSEYVPELESAVDGPTASQEGGLQTSRSVVPVALASHFGEFQHQKNCCDNCAAPCDPSMEQGFACNCGAIVCRRFCYGLTLKQYQTFVRTDEFKYECDSCREQHCGEQQLMRGGLQQISACFACRKRLSGLQAQCPKCLGRFCQGCACMARFEVPRGTSNLNLLCPTCVGQTQYENARERIVVSLLIKVVGNPASRKLTREQLRNSKDWADQLGDLLYDLYYSGYRTVFEKHLSSFLDIVEAQLQHMIVPSVDPFHLLYYMGKSLKANTYLLARVCRAQAEDALAKGRSLLSTVTATPETSSPPGERPAVLRVGIYGYDIVQNSPLADLQWSALQHFRKDPRYEIILFAEGPVDVSHPPAKDIAQLFQANLHLFSSGMSSSAKYAIFREAELNIVLTLAGWTYGHIADVFAAVGSGPSAIPVVNWLGFAGLMCMPEGVHYTIAGSLAPSQRQKQECERVRERLALLSCYQPCQGHPSHRLTDRPLTRQDFNLPSSETTFIFFYASTINRVEKDVFFDWLTIVSRVSMSCLLMLNKPKGMRCTIKRWTKEFVESVDPSFDPAKVIFRPVQNKPYFWALLRVVGERGACLDSVQPIGPHTGASDALSNYVPILSWVSENGGWQMRVVIEVLAAAGLLRECAASDRAAFVAHAVEFAGNRPLQLAIRSFLERSVDEGINLFDTSMVPGAVLSLVEQIFQAFAAAGGDLARLKDIDVRASLPPVQQFSDSPEAAALASESEETKSKKAKREELLAGMLKLCPPLASEMADHAMQIMQEHQDAGLMLDSIVGDGGFSVVIKATALSAINAYVPPGTDTALKIAKEGCPIRHLKNTSLIRQGICMIRQECRLRQQEFANIVTKPVYVWSTQKNGRCFMGHSSLDCKSGKVLPFLCEEFISGKFRDAIKPFGVSWRSSGEFSEELQFSFTRPMFQLAFELRYSAAMALMDVKPGNLAQRPDSRLVAVDLGNAIIFDKPGDANNTAAMPAPLSRGITVAEDSSGKATKTTGRVLIGVRHNSQLFVISNQKVSDFCAAHFEQGKGFGRVCKGTYGYSNQAAQHGKYVTEEGGFGEDMYGFGRSLLKEMSHDPKRETLCAWETRACEAEKAGSDGIRRLLLSVVPLGVKVSQLKVLDRLCDLLAGLLHPKLELRMDAKKALTHPLNTLPILSPGFYRAIHEGPGVEMPGGLVQSLPDAIRLHPDLQGEGEELPPLLLLEQGDMGVGVQLRRKLKKGKPAAVYIGKFIDCANKGALRRTFPSRFSITTRAATYLKQVNSFVCDASSTKERPFEWFIANNNAGPFMNGIDEQSWQINCNLDRQSAYLIGDDVVYILYANRDIEEGEFLMWKYNHRAGASLLIPGLSFSFD